MSFETTHQCFLDQKKQLTFTSTFTPVLFYFHLGIYLNNVCLAFLTGDISILKYIIVGCYVRNLGHCAVMVSHRITFSGEVSFIFPRWIF